FIVLLGSGGAPASALGAAGGSQCATSGPLAGLSDGQAQSARTIVATATPIGGQKAALIAVMVALGETRLTNIDHGDRDSLGLFQQRANWGTSAQRMDPVWATTAFLTAPNLGLLVKVPGWKNLNPWIAAQGVQGSAWDGHTAQAQGLPPARDALTGKIVPPDGYGVGANYQAQHARAQAILAVIDGDAVKLDCGGIPSTLPPGDAARHGLPAAYDIRSIGANPAETKAVTFALAQLDKPYVFGAVGSDAFDCSGLMMAAWAQAAVILSHWTITQAEAGTPVASPAQMSPGDLILVPGSDGTLSAPGHVGMYIGHGLVVDAADEQVGIIVQPYREFVRVGGGLSGIRHIG
ncbi:MAG: C40 family peptidase, partial [Jatrophihabitantaceae bacterium]